MAVSTFEIDASAAVQFDNALDLGACIPHPPSSGNTAGAAVVVPIADTGSVVVVDDDEQHVVAVPSKFWDHPYCDCCCGICS